MQNINSSTLKFYNDNADKYFHDTVLVDMKEAYCRFKKYINPKGCIIDIGAGSGRDIKYFLDEGFDAQGIDASEELCKRASEYSGVEVECMGIEDWIPRVEYDGIRANASFVHLSLEKIRAFILIILEALKPTGVAYLSFKYGIESGMDPFGRYFSNVTDEFLDSVISSIPTIEVVEKWKSEDKMGRGKFHWINVILKKH